MLKLKKNYDITTSYVETPAGLGKYISFDPMTGKVTVEIDSMYLVEFDGEKCFLLRDDVWAQKKDAI